MSIRGGPGGLLSCLRVQKLTPQASWEHLGGGCRTLCLSHEEGAPTLHSPQELSFNEIVFSRRLARALPTSGANESTCPLPAPWIAGQLQRLRRPHPAPPQAGGGGLANFTLDLNHVPVDHLTECFAISGWQCPGDLLHSPAGALAFLKRARRPRYSVASRG